MQPVLIFFLHTVALPTCGSKAQNSFGASAVAAGAARFGNRRSRRQVLRTHRSHLKCCQLTLSTPGRK